MEFSFLALSLQLVDFLSLLLILNPKKLLLFLKVEFGLLAF